MLAVSLIILSCSRFPLMPHRGAKSRAVHDAAEGQMSGILRGHFRREKKPVSQSLFSFGHTRLIPKAARGFALTRRSAGRLLLTG